jgi:hypothetical protein
MKDAAWFEANLTDEYLQITEEGVRIKPTPGHRDVKSFSFDFAGEDQ